MAYTGAVDRETFLESLRRTRFAPGDRDRARADAAAIATWLKCEYGARVIGIGSAFAGDRPFRRSSDIDLVVEGLPAADFFRACARAADMTRFALDLIPLESATPLLIARVRDEGVEL